MLKANEVIAGKYWIVNSGDGRKVGTLRAIDAGYEFFDSRTNTTSTYDSMDEFNVLERGEVKEDNALIQGYPTGVSEPVAVVHDRLPAFTKTKTAKQVFVAGYYIVKFDGMGWQWAFAPRLATVDKYQYRGPFLTEWEMNLELKKYKRGNIDGETKASIGAPGTG